MNIARSRLAIFCKCSLLPRIVPCLAVIASLAASAPAHESSIHRARRQRDASLAAAAAGALTLVTTTAQDEPTTCRLALTVRDAATGKAAHAIVRVTDLATGKAVPLAGEIHRELNWFSLRPESTLAVPRAKLRVEAFQGIESKRVALEIDTTNLAEAKAELRLTKLYDPREHGWKNGNTHLHLMKMSMPEALNYLQVVGRSDNLDLIFLSHLRRIPDERDYISNQIVEESFRGGSLQRLSQTGTLFANGQEHRHNYGRGGEGYGHVMLLDLVKLIQPVSIGPGIMMEGVDAPPLRRGIRAARDDDATIVWCHNTFGLEDLPNWATGELHALNIFDGGEHGSYEDTFYRYLNLGWHVPFSTGTDWFVYDFSRVYVPLAEPLTAKNWLAQLRAGRTYITNGTLLEFTLNDRPIGDTLRLDAPATLRVRSRGVGRNDFRAIELIHNGRVVRRAQAKPVDGGFAAEFDEPIRVAESGWLAVRIPRDAGPNEFGKPLFAHTSAIHVELAGKRIFQPEVARQLITEMEANLRTIREQSKFDSEDQRQAVLQVHEEGLKALRGRLP